MVEFPEKIWAIEKGCPSRYRVSCSVLEHGPDEATEYVRADLYAALEAQLAEARKALEQIERKICAAEHGHTINDVLANYREVRRTVQDARAARRALEGGKEE